MTSSNLYQYIDYKDYLRSFVETKQMGQKGWSLNVWATNLGLKSKSTLSMILNGKRIPNEITTAKLVRYFKFNQKESNYFQDMIKLKKVENDPELVITIMNRMKRNHPKKSLNMMAIEEFNVISKWYYYVIREILTTTSWDGTTEDILKKMEFKITMPQLEKAISDMEMLGFIKKNKAGKLIPGGGYLTSSDEIESEALKLFHKGHLENAISGLKKFKVSERYYSGISMNINNDTKTLQLIKDRIKNFEDELIRDFSKDRGGRTFQFNFNTHPLSK